MQLFMSQATKRTIVCTVLAMFWMASCGDGSAPDQRPRAAFEGRFSLQTINNSALPVAIPWSQGRTFKVTLGEAFLPAGTFNFGLTGEVEGVPSIVLFAEPAYASLTASDSFYLDNGMRGRVNGDTLELQTTPIHYGDHRWRFLLPQVP